MAAPQVLEISVKVPKKAIITFDQALDTSVNVPLTSFSINYGRVAIERWDYYGTAAIVLTLAKPLTYNDKAELNYQPPDDINLALRAPVPDDANNIVLRRNVVRAFYKVPIKILLRPDEAPWNEMSNLGVSDAGPIYGEHPEGGGDDHHHHHWDPCHNGSVGGDGHEHGNGGTGGREHGQLRGPAGRRNSQHPNAGYGNYPIRTRPNPRAATPDDFILAFGLREAIQLSNLDDADAIQPNTDKIWMAIQDACALIDNYIVQASRSGKLLISSNRRRTALIIARYYLDSVRRREDVKEDYERCLKELDRAMSLESLVRPDPPWWADPCNPRRGSGVRSWRIPQIYNGVSGKGLSGWWTDSGYEQINDWRFDRLNSEGNNDEPNWRPRANLDDSRLPQSPADDGGIQYSGNNGSSP